MKTIKLSVLVLSSILLFNSCGNGLSRSKAEKIIRNQENLPETKYFMLHYEASIPTDAERHDNDIYTKLEKKGLIKLIEIGEKDYIIGGFCKIYSVELTSEGKKYEIPFEKYTDKMKKDVDFQRSTFRNDPNFTLVKTHEIDLNSVVSLQQTSEFEIIANYDTKIINQTPIFEILDENSKWIHGNEAGFKPYQGEKVFRKYDDGWK